jgi:hypothetical protein
LSTQYCRKSARPYDELPVRLLCHCACIFVVLAAVAGCQTPRGPVSVNSDDPDLQIQAMEQDAGDKNSTDIPKMVADLQSDDPAIRFYAIQALRRLTHDDFGYRFYEDEDHRKAALARWQAWLKEQR